VKPSERCLRDAALIHAFREAYIDLLNSARMADGEFFLPVLAPAVDHVTWQHKRLAVAAAAGAASSAFQRYGGTMTFHTGGYIQSVDPMANWELSVKDPKQMAPETVISSADAAVALAKQKGIEAAQRERGLTGLIAAFLRWPANLREAVGTGHRAQRRAASVIGVIGQVMVTAVAGALTVGLVAGVVALWRLVF
jgi:hypothetical protein